jgi:DNA-binding transcriptional regulator LsrR (DeoR family)
MKTLGAGHYLFPESGITAEVLIRFALAQQVDQVIVGCGTEEEVSTLVTAGRAGPLETEEADRLAAVFLPHAAAFAYYRSQV